MSVDKLKNAEYFGAVNSYDGFVSYFDSIFASQDFEKIFVIKGGPGSGKSSFMKKMQRELSHMYSTEVIRCSSDPGSFDGLIIEQNEKRIALLDGTAPHLTDPPLPGAVGEILNFEEFWDERWLRAKKEKISGLNKEKTAEYKIAYSYLMNAGYIYGSKKSIIRNYYDGRAAKAYALNIIKTLEVKNFGNPKIRITSAFCKNGVIRLETLSKLGKEKIKIDLPLPLYYLFTEEIKNALDMFGISYTSFLSAPERETEAIYIEDLDTLIIRDGGERSIKPDLISIKAELIEERVKEFSRLEEGAKEEAVRHFGIASELHFALEEIYTGAMNFSLIDKCFDKTVCKVKKILD